MVLDELRFAKITEEHQTSSVTFSPRREKTGGHEYPWKPDNLEQVLRSDAFMIT